MCSCVMGFRGSVPTHTALFHEGSTQIAHRSVALAASNPRTGALTTSTCYAGADLGEEAAFGALLKRYRLAAGLTHEALAERAALSTRAISDLERGVSRAPRSETLALLVQALPLAPEQRAALVAAARRAAPPDEWGPTHNLPIQLTSFIGRDQESLFEKVWQLSWRRGAARLAGQVAYCDSSTRYARCGPAVALLTPLAWWAGMIATQP
jgi:transcriptional regulator with XRE-family HTH domain